MKKCLIFSYVALILSIIVSGRGAEVTKPKETTPKIEISEYRAPETLPPTAEPESQPSTVRVLHNSAVTEMDMEEYIIGVTAAEMPASFEPEALKAQAVAARSYALYCMRSGKHPDADVCTDPACCQAWQSEEELREKWGDKEEYYEKISAAVSSTAGEYLSYGGQAVFAAFHSSSAGETEDSGEIWSPVPYLVSVSSPESEKDVPNFVSTVDCAPLDFRDTILHDHPEADFTSPRAGWVTELRRDNSGRVDTAVIGGTEISGAELRRLFSLRSTAFTLDYTGSAFCFTVTGYGHGVGMSQYGANVMARDGYSYRDILFHYYPETELKTM